LDTKLVQLNDALKEAIEMGEKKPIGAAYLEIGIYLHNQYKYQSATPFFQKSLSIYELLHDKAKIAIIYNALGRCMLYTKRIDVALNYFYIAINLYENLDKLDHIAGCHYNIGILFENIKDNANARFHFLKSIEFFEKNINDTNHLTNEIKIANIYCKLNQPKKARSILLKINYEGPEFKALPVLLQIAAISDLGLSYFMENDTTNALSCLLKTFEFNTQGVSIIENYILLSQIYLEQNDMAQCESILHIIEPLLVNKEQDLVNYKKEFLLIKSQYHEKQGNYKAALKEYKRMKEIDDIISKNEQTNRSKMIEANYKVQEEKRKSNLIEQSLIIKDQILANISHELRTPLNAVIGMSHLLKDMDHTQEVNEYIKIINDSSLHLSKIIKDLIDLSQSQLGNLSFNNQPFAVSHLLESSMKVFQPVAIAQKIDFHYSINEKVPLYLVGDETRLKQILFNLIDNAFKNTKKGAIMVDIKLVEQLDEKATIFIQVIDTGYGIARHRLTEIFDSFTQISKGNTRKQQGIGIGLSLVNNLITLMGGKLTVDSESGVGSTFSILLTLPVSDAASITNQNELQKIENENDISSNKIINILSVEDNKFNQLYIKKILNNPYIKLDLAKDGYEALEAISNKKYDIILTDIQMPNMDGFELYDKIQHNAYSLNKTTPVIAVTANALYTEKEKALDLGMKDYIIKPFKPLALIRTIALYANMNKKLLETGGLYLKHFTALFGENKEWLNESMHTFLDELNTSCEILALPENLENKTLLKYEINKITNTLRMYKLKELIPDLEEAELSLATDQSNTYITSLQSFILKASEACKLLSIELELMKNLYN